MPKIEDKEIDDKKEEAGADPFGIDITKATTEENPPEEKKDAPDNEDITDEDVNNVIKKSVEESDVVTNLQTKLDDYSKNLKGQNDIITKLENKIAELSNGGKKDTEIEVLFKEIKTSKDLTQEEREEMTPTEIALMDKNAETQKALNKMYETIALSKKNVEQEKVENLNYSSRMEAGRLAMEAIKTNPTLAQNAEELTDKILLEFREFNNDGITSDVLATRMSKALNNVEGYIPPREQATVPTGGTNPVQAGAGSATDPFGNEVIIAEANANNDGNYKL